MKKIFCIVGTRPEVIKMAPIINLLKKQLWCNTTVIATAQHRQLLDQMLDFFAIKPDIDLNIMTENQDLTELTANLMNQLKAIFKSGRPDAIVAQGDTTTVLATAMVCFYLKIPFCHVEAGLRTHSIDNPFPEEMNRVFADRLASLNFAPTETARQNLLAEGVDEQTIHITGNTVVDSLLKIVTANFNHGLNLDLTKRTVVLTVHRRENIGKPLAQICQAVLELVSKVPDIQIVCPVHPNPNIRQVIEAKLGNHPQILLCEPLDYPALISLIKQSYCVITDSGGLQEEVPVLGKPVLVLRDNSERPESIEAKIAQLVGTQAESIVRAALQLLNNHIYYKQVAKPTSLYGKGDAAEKIVQILYYNLIGKTVIAA